MRASPVGDFAEGGALGENTGAITDNGRPVLFRSRTPTTSLLLPVHVLGVAALTSSSLSADVASSRREFIISSRSILANAALILSSNASPLPLRIVHQCR